MTPLEGQHQHIQGKEDASGITSVCVDVDVDESTR